MQRENAVGIFTLHPLKNTYSDRRSPAQLVCTPFWVYKKNKIVMGENVGSKAVL
jgi:hypothetical protein